MRRVRSPPVTKPAILEPLACYARTPARNGATVLVMGLPALAFAVVPFLLTDASWWLKLLGPGLALVLLYQLRAIFENWNLRTELYACELV